MSMNDILTQINSSPVLLICLLLVIYTITAMLRRGEIGSIGKDGIKFNRSFIDSAQIDSLKKDVAELQVSSKIMLDTIHAIELATIRLQIMSEKTDFHTKLKLYDEYKSKGGNSYIDVYIQQIKKEALCAEN